MSAIIFSVQRSENSHMSGIFSHMFDKIQKVAICSAYFPICPSYFPICPTVQKVVKFPYVRHIFPYVRGSGKICRTYYVRLPPITSGDQFGLDYRPQFAYNQSITQLINYNPCIFIGISILRIRKLSLSGYGKLVRQKSYFSSVQSTKKCILIITLL
jgi:hypothetical protein